MACKLQDQLCHDQQFTSDGCIEANTACIIKAEFSPTAFNQTSEFFSGIHNDVIAFLDQTADHMHSRIDMSVSRSGIKYDFFHDISSCNLT